MGGGTQTTTATPSSVLALAPLPGCCSVRRAGEDTEAVPAAVGRASPWQPKGSAAADSAWPQLPPQGTARASLPGCSSASSGTSFTAAALEVSLSKLAGANCPPWAGQASTKGQGDALCHLMSWHSWVAAAAASPKCPQPATAMAQRSQENPALPFQGTLEPSEGSVVPEQLPGTGLGTVAAWPSPQDGRGGSLPRQGG